jgi:hypothetical protein
MARCVPTQPAFIDPNQGFIFYIGVSIDAAKQADGVRLDISADCRIVVAVYVLMQPGLFIEVLPGESQVEVERPCSIRIFVRHIVAERIGIVPLPFYFA